MRTRAPAAIAIALTLSLAVVGCGNKNKPNRASTTGGATGTEANTGTVGGANEQKTASITYALFPGDANLLVGITGEKLRASKLLVDQVSKSFGNQLAQLKSCGIDVINSVETVVAALNQSTGDGVVVVRGFTARDLVHCASRQVSLGVKMRTEGQLHVVEKDHVTSYVGWLDANTAIMGPTKSKVLAGLAGAGGLDKNAEMAGLLDKVDTAAAVYAAYRFPGGTQSTPVGTLNGAFVSLFLSDGFKLSGGVAMPDESAAKSASATINQQLGALSSSPFGSYLAGLKIQDNGPDLGIDLSLTNTQVKQLVQLLQNNPMIQMMLQGAMGGGGSTQPSPPPTP